MENEKFQEIVLEHLAKLSQENNELKNELKAEINQLKIEMNQNMDKLESKVDCAIKEIASLREDVTGLQNEKFEIKRVK